MTLGTFTILGKNAANLFTVPGSHHFESVGPATIWNLAVQSLLAAIIVALVVGRPKWRAAAFGATALVSTIAFVSLNAWASSSLP